MDFPKCVDLNGEEWNLNDIVAIYDPFDEEVEYLTVERLVFQKDYRWYLDTMTLGYLIAADSVEHYHGELPIPEGVEDYDI